MAPVEIKFLLAGVQSASGRTLQMKFDTQNTVAQVKETIIRDWPADLKDVDIARRKMRLVKSGTVLEDSKSLHECGIHPDNVTTLHLMLQQLEPAPAPAPEAQPTKCCCTVM